MANSIHVYHDQTLLAESWSALGAKATTITVRRLNHNCKGSKLKKNDMRGQSLVSVGSDILSCFLLSLKKMKLKFKVVFVHYKFMYLMIGLTCTVGVCIR